MSTNRPKTRSTQELLRDIGERSYKQRHPIKNNTSLVDEEEWGTDIIHLNLPFIILPSGELGAYSEA